MSRNQRQRRRYKVNPKQQKTIKILIAVVILLVAVVGYLLINNYIKNKPQNLDEAPTDQIATEETQEQPEEQEIVLEDEVEEPKTKPEDTTIVLTSIGDIMCHNTQYQDAFNSETNTYDFSYMFKDIKYYTQIGDITVGNLETTFGGAERKYSSYPTFNTPDELATTLKNLGLDLLSTANNHCLDTGYEGLERTIDVLDKADISHLGTYKSEEDRKKVAIQYAKGVKIAFVNYTYGTNGIAIPGDKTYSVNLINKELIAEDLKRVKAENPDVIVAMMHWGQEYQTSPNAEQTDMADFLFQNGVNVILGGHPHVLQPMEKRTVTLEDGTQKDGFVIYSLGNFSADQKADNTKASIILNLSITKHEDGSITIDKADYVPINMFKDTKQKTQKFRLMDIERELEYYDAGDLSLGATNYSYLQKQLASITSIVGPEF